jgi:hypothetical protein
MPPARPSGRESSRATDTYGHGARRMSADSSDAELARITRRAFVLGKAEGRAETIALLRIQAQAWVEKAERRIAGDSSDRAATRQTAEALCVNIAVLEEKGQTMPEVYAELVATARQERLGQPTQQRHHRHPAAVQPIPVVLAGDPVQRRSDNARLPVADFDQRSN